MGPWPIVEDETAVPFTLKFKHESVVLQLRVVEPPTEAPLAQLLLSSLKRPAVLKASTETE